MDEMMEILKNLDWSPLFISIKTGIVATIFSFFLGIYAARKVVKTTPGKKAIIDGILTLPMVLPPTVAGFFLLLIFSRRRPFGIFLFENFGIKVVQTWLGCIIAATVISFPLMYRNARAAMEQMCREEGVTFYHPSPILCTDNAAMIGAAAYYDFVAGKRSGLDLNAVPNLKLGES